MISKESYNKLIAKKQTINDTISKLNNTNLKLNQTTKETFINNNLDIPLSSISLAHLLKRPEIKIDFLNNFITLPDNKEILEQVEIMIKYEGYIAKANKEVEKLLNLENKIIPDDIDYTKVSNLASEALQKLSKVRPRTIAQATRISGVNPSDIAVLTVYLKKEYNKNE